ncbi:MAG: DUF134 domain-containing protein [Clostridia bacterium]|nr:DUF134 domain-containing protein [Clostridia bacterium]
MPRPIRCRKIGCLPVYRSFSPDDAEADETVSVTLDEFETMRLIDGEGLTQAECAERMNVSRTTVTAVYESARRTIADALINGKRLIVTGGCCSYALPDEPENLNNKGENTMRIAVTFENGEVFQHFGHTESFKIYDVEDGKIVNEQIVPTDGTGHGALAGFLKASKVDALICGGIGMGARLALDEAEIAIYGGVTGPADEAAKALAENRLAFDPNVKCDHREHHHGDCHGEHHHGGCGHEHCAEHKCGNN